MNTPPIDRLMFTREEGSLARQYIDTLWRACTRSKSRGTGDTFIAVDWNLARFVFDTARAELSDPAFTWMVDEVSGTFVYEHKTIDDRIHYTEWSMYWPRCVWCNRKIRRHHSNGACSGCYEATLRLNNLRRGLRGEKQIQELEYDQSQRQVAPHSKRLMGDVPRGRVPHTGGYRGSSHPGRWVSPGYSSAMQAFDAVLQELREEAPGSSLGPKVLYSDSPHDGEAPKDDGGAAEELHDRPEILDEDDGSIEPPDRLGRSCDTGE